MIDTKYGLKYSFPHSIVHIVDNSSNEVVDVTSIADDPSLYAAIVVTGAPIGEDNRMLNITRSDVLNVAFGMSSLTASDVERYGQAVQYASSLIEQGAPVKFMRVTPPGSTYAVATVLVQWRINASTNKFEVRFKLMDGSDPAYGYMARGIDLSRYKNTERLNSAIVSSVKNSVVWPSEYDGWNTRVFVNFISAGRGKNYNNMCAFINKAEQTKKPTNIRYEFGTINTLTNQILEDFYAALINDSTVNGVTTNNVDTVNIAVKKRVDGSSVIVPYVNESAIGEVYKAYREYFGGIITAGNNQTYVANKDLYDTIYNRLTINTFDPVYGKFMYSNIEDVEVDLPFYQVDMYDINVPKMDSAHRIDMVTSGTPWSTLDPGSPTSDGHYATWVVQDWTIMKLANQLVGVAGNSEYTGPYVGDVYLSTNGSTPIFNLVTAINQYSGNISYMAIPRVYPVKIDGNDTVIDYTGEISASVQIKGIYPDVAENWNATVDAIVDKLNRKTTAGTFAVGDVIALTCTSDNVTDFILVKIQSTNVNTGKVVTVLKYPKNIYAALDFRTTINGDTGTDNVIVRDSKVTVDGGVESSTIPAWNVAGALRIDDRTQTNLEDTRKVRLFIPEADKHYTQATDPSWITVASETAGFATYKLFKIGNVPTSVSISNNIVGSTYDVFTKTAADAEPSAIDRVVVTGVINSTIKVSSDPTVIPSNYYDEFYGDSLYSEAGGVKLALGDAGFFDDLTMNSIVFKWKYSDLMTSAFRGEIDPRIMSPTRMPAKFLFDAGWNTVIGLTQLPFTYPDISDVIYASTAFTDDEKTELQYNQSLISGIGTYTDIDVKQAMYDLMIYRCYQGIPEEKRPIGPGSGLSLHLDAGMADAETALAINKSFGARFDNPNASWDIGGYTDSVNGITYTYTKRLVDNLAAHCKRYTVNKPFVGQYTTINRDEYISYFPDIDTTDWELRELLYNSGGNAWVADTNGNITRRSQRTLMRSSTTSDLLQENNMRTLSQLVYLLQNKIDTYLLEYDDDGVLQTLSEDCSNMFSGWVGTRVQALNISFERDKNIDGGDIVVCYVNVTFRGLILRVPIIVNVNRRVSTNS